MTRVTRFAKSAVFGAVLFLAACGGKEEPDTAESDVLITPGFVRVPGPGATATAGYLSVKSTQGDVLLSATTPLAESMEIHTSTTNDQGVVSMRPLERLEVPAGETVELTPGGDHLMLISPDPSMTYADEIVVTLTFEKAGLQTIVLPLGDGY